MKKYKKYIIIGVIIFIFILALGIGIYFYFNSNKLTIGEKKWLDEARSTSKVINVNVENDIDVFGKDGSGIFYDLLDDIAEKYNLNINHVTYNYNNNVSGLTLGSKKEVNDNDIILFTDHYVLISKNKNVVDDINDLTNKNINILQSDLSYVTKYINNNSISFTSFNDATELINKTTEENYAILPLHLFMSNIITKDLEIVYHFSDIKLYYTLTKTKGDSFSNILAKFYYNWQEEFIKYYNTNLFNVITKSLNITDTEIDAMRSVEYKYGYVNNSPYEVLSKGNYGGIAAIYLKSFMDFAGVDFDIVKYHNINKFSKAIANKKVDVFFNYYNIDSNYYKTANGISASYVIIAHKQNELVINSINSLIGKTVYVEKNSYLYNYLQNISGIKIETYNTAKELKKINKKNVIIMLDSNMFSYYQNNGLENYSIRFQNDINHLYGFSVKTDTSLYKYLNKYMSIVDSKEVINKGIYNHEKIVKSGLIISLIIKYFFYILLIGLVVLFFIIRKTKKITVAKKIKKDDKIRFIDQLTLLKNRNYLNENIKEWNNNTIYPQTILIIDLNHLQQINDIKGYDEGNKQIKAAANSLIKTQLDNSDIIRTDGNEFVVYLVGYSQKQITNYIHKLTKEFRKLPYGYGAEFGYSMILDDIKTIEDALAEATKDLKEKKEMNENKD